MIFSDLNLLIPYISSLRSCHADNESIPDSLEEAMNIMETLNDWDNVKEDGKKRPTDVPNIGADVKVLDIGMEKTSPLDDLSPNGARRDPKSVGVMVCKYEKRVDEPESYGMGESLGVEMGPAETMVEEKQWGLMTDEHECSSHCISCLGTLNLPLQYNDHLNLKNFILQEIKGKSTMEDKYIQTLGDPNIAANTRLSQGTSALVVYVSPWFKWLIMVIIDKGGLFCLSWSYVAVGWVLVRARPFVLIFDPGGRHERAMLVEMACYVHEPCECVEVQNFYFFSSYYQI